MTEQEKHLLDLFRQLDEKSGYSLVRFAEFLVNDISSTETTTFEPQQATQVEKPAELALEINDQLIPKPLNIERPEVERVVDAIKRLSETYPMVDKKSVLDKAAGLVAEHVMHGQPARVVIDKLEVMFRDAYDKMVTDSNK